MEYEFERGETTGLVADPVGGIEEDFLDDDEFAGEDDFAEDEFVDDSGTNDTEDGNVPTESLNEVNYFDDEGTDDDEQIIESLREELRNKGYSISNELDYAELQVLSKRLYKDDEEEEAELTKILASQAESLEELPIDIETQQATLLPQGKSEEQQLQDLSTFSMDRVLGQDLTLELSRWMNEAVREDPDITADEIYQSFMSMHQQKTGKAAIYAEHVHKYVCTMTPIVRESYLRGIQQLRVNSKIRERSAQYYCRSEHKNTGSLINAKRHTLIRQIFEYSDGHCETICPCCGKRVKLIGPAFRIVSFAAESKTNNVPFMGYLGCECGAALMFTFEEFSRMCMSYLKECKTSIDAYISEAKVNCVGSAVMITSVPVDAVRATIPYLFISEVGQTQSVTKMVEQEDVPVVLVDDEEFRQAVDQFYFKLKGLTGPSFKHEEAELAESFEKDKQESGEVDASMFKLAHDTLKLESQFSWTYHDAAVYVMQCLSRDYYIERNKALFSLIYHFKENAVLEKELSMSCIWALECAIDFVEGLDLEKDNRELSKEERVQLMMCFNQVRVLKDDDTLLEQALAALPELKELLVTKRSDRDALLTKLEAHKEQLSFLKVYKLNVCRLADLQAFLADDRSIALFAEVADRMLIKSCSEEFYEYWKSLKVLTANRLRNAFEVKADLRAVETTLVKMYNDVFVLRNSWQKLEPIIDRNVEREEFLSKLHKAFIRLDYYDFIKLVNDVPVRVLEDSATTDLIRKLNVCDSRIARCRGMSKAEVYLVDFTANEIKECDKCNNLLFERYTPIRLPGESINDYCDRYEKIYEAGEFNPITCHDSAQLFEPFKDVILEISLCSVIQDAEFASRGKALFMDALICECCNTSGYESHLTHVLGVSPMQLNIIKSVSPDVVGFAGYEKAYKIIHGIYLSSLQKEMDRLCVKYEEVNVFASMSSKEIMKSFDFAAEIQNILIADTSALDEETSANDKEDADAEVAHYFGGSFEDLTDWLGMKA